MGKPSWIMIFLSPTETVGGDLGSYPYTLFSVRGQSRIDWSCDPEPV